ncbi:hypothetical protein NMY22_g4948 [Coprinellus aureogranulatus]|nr:hypothetical protein NMY22_g4948 [Coprinellus aureogranulatus]
MTKEDDLCSSSCSTCTSTSDSESYTSSSAATSHDAAPLALFQQLEKEIGNNLHLNVDIAKFVHEVWNVDEDTIEKLLSMPVKVDASELASYKQHTDENDLHKSFRCIANQLLEDAFKGAGEKIRETFSDAFWDRLERESNNAARYRLPDMISSVDPLPADGSAPALSTVKDMIEFKRATEDDDANEGDEDRQRETPISNQPDKGTARDVEETAAAGPSTTSSSKQAVSSLKRSFDSVEGPDDAHGSALKKQRQRRGQPLRNTLMPLYATETLASSSRYYVVGLVIDRLDVTVCYFDRFLVSCVASFSFEAEPSKLALLLYAMNQCDRLHAGFDPHLRHSCSDGAEAKADKLSEVDLPPEDGVVGSCFEYTVPKPEAPSTEGDPPLCFRVSEVIRRPDELIGRATAVYKVHLRLPDGAFSPDPHVYKLSWPLKDAPSEIDVVKALKGKLPKEAHDHFPDFLFTTTFTAHDLKLPWLRFGLNLAEGNHQNRELRGMLGKYYHKLWEAGSVENFKQAWLDCVECLYLARKLGKVLHHDISEGNLMVLKLAGETVKGVLNDWDLAKIVSGDDSNPSSAEVRTGTPPFMAHDHLGRTHFPHWFRHDLESLFYILIWAALHYNLKDGTRDRKPHPSVAGWVGDIDENRTVKLRILSFDRDTTNEIFEGVKPEFASVLEEWIKPLRLLFADAWSSHHHSCLADADPPDPITWGGKLTFKKFMDAIHVTPRTWGIPDFLEDDESSGTTSSYFAPFPDLHELHTTDILLSNSERMFNVHSQLSERPPSSTHPSSVLGMEPFKRKLTASTVPASHDGTPHKPTQRSLSYSSNRADGNKVVKFSPRDIYDHLKVEIGPFRHTNIDLGLFVQHVWGVPPDDIQNLLAAEFTLEASDVTTYRLITKENELHQPFLKFADFLLKGAVQLLEKEFDDVHSVTFWDGKGNKILVQDGRERKPDLLGLWKPGVPNSEIPKWNNVKAVIEFKKNKVKEKDGEKGESTSNSKGKLAKKEVASKKHSTRSRKGKTKPARDARSMPILTNEPSTSSVGVKRKNEYDATETERKKKKSSKVVSDDAAVGEENQEEVEAGSSVKRTLELSLAQLQLASYGLETLASTSRFYVVGVLVDRFKVTVSYFDRFLVMCTATFNFEKEPQKLALIIYAINHSNRQQSGFDPHHLTWSSLTSDVDITEAMQSQLTKPVDEIVGSYIELPDSSNVVSVADTIATTTLTDTSVDSPSPGASGEPAQSTRGKTLSFVIDEILRRPDDIVGRGTIVFRVRCRLPNGELSKEAYAYKLSWPIEKRTSEVATIQRLRRDLSEDALKHLPEALFTTTSSAEELDLPWTRMGLPLSEENHQERVLRRIIFKSYKSLWEAGTLPNFKQAWLDCLEIHHYAYSKGKIFHRDIHEHNLMVAVHNGEAVGVLNDWDMAKVIGDEDDGLTAAIHRTGSLPFLALDLIKKTGRTVHCYRHDLEAFFYVLLWAIVHYNLKDKTRDSEAHACLVKWVGSRDENASLKKDILSFEREPMADIVSAAKKEFEPLVNEWVKPLRLFLARGRQTYDQQIAFGTLADGEGEETWGGTVTFKKLLKEIKVEPRDFGDHEYAEFLKNSD